MWNVNRAAQSRATCCEAIANVERARALLCPLPAADGAVLIRIEKFEFSLRNVYLIWVAALRAGRLGELKVKDAFRFSMC